MADQREQLARIFHIYSPRSTAHTLHHESEGDREFSFWGSSNITSSENDCDKLGGNEAIRLNKEETEFRETEFEQYSPFLSHTHHHCCSLSDTSRSKDIEEGRREVMEMIQDMPESSYELSFQDMVVDEKHVQQPDQNETSLDNTQHMHSSSSNSNKAQLKKLNNKKKEKEKKKKKSNSRNRPGQILRVESMESETFLLKMFFPSSLKKIKVENGSSKVSPRPSSLQESIKQVGKEWIRIKRFFQAGHNRGDMEDGMCQNTSSNIKNRNFDRNFSFSSLGCLPFFHHSKNKAKELVE